MKKKSSFYLNEDMLKEMKKEAVELDLGFPSDFIEYLWNYYRERRYYMTGDKFHDRLVELAEKMDYSEYHIQGGELYLLDENGEVVHTEEMPG